MAILEKDLMQFLDIEFVEDTKKDGWEIKSDDAANWALRKIKQAEQNIANRAELVKREIERIQRWAEQADQDDKASINFFTVALQGYYKELTDKGRLGKRKSYKLPCGTIGTRKKQAVLERDDEKLMPLARQYGLTETVEKLKWAEFKKKVMVKGYQAFDVETGELLDGVTVVEKEEEDGNFYVKTE